MSLEQNKADFARKFAVVRGAVDDAFTEFDQWLLKDIDKAIELIAELRGKLGEKEIELAEFERQVEELKMDRFAAEGGHIDAVADPPLAQATPGGPIESQITEEPTHEQEAT